MVTSLAARGSVVVVMPQAAWKNAGAWTITPQVVRARRLAEGGLMSAKPKLTVLVVDDEPLIGELIKDMLSELDCDVVGPATTVSAAQSLAHANGIGAALLDVNLGGQTVFPLAQALAAKGVRLAFITGADAGSLPAQWRNHPFIGKPINLAQLTGVVDRLR
jgi:CheY-like chemotaxis protein